MRTYLTVAMALVALLAVSTATPAHAYCGSQIQPGGWYKYVCTPNSPPGSGRSGGSRQYGAIAYSPATGNYGYSDNYPDETQAERRALSECSQADCVIGIWFWNQCGALATADNGSWGADRGASQAQAQSLALARCRKENGDNCQIKLSHCSGG